MQPKSASHRQHLSTPAHFKKRGINVVAKAPKGQSKKLQLYDYTAALIVGIDRYENLEKSEQLTYAVKDAKGVEKILRDSFQFDEIVTLYNEEATRDKIMQVLYGFRSLTPEGGLFVYFAGHGITIPGALGGRDLGYLIPYDGSLNAAAMYKNISMQQVKSDICVSISAKHVFFVFDACFAGLMLDTRSTLIKPGRDFSYLKAITAEQVRQVLTAGSKGETVLDGGPGGHSVFTGRLIQALRSTEDYITARELGQYLKKQVYADAVARGHTQRPLDGEIYGTGDFVFVPDADKKRKEINAEVYALETEIARLNILKKEAAQARNKSRERDIERQKLIKDAKLKQILIRKREREAAEKHKSQGMLVVEQFEKYRRHRETEKQQQIVILRMKANKMRQELSQESIQGLTIDSAVAKLKAIEEQREKITSDFTTEFENQANSLSAVYDKKIARIMDIPPWDKEFETAKVFQARVDVAEIKAAPFRKEKRGRLVSLRHALETVRDDALRMLNKQRKILLAKRFHVSASQVRFSFVEYFLKSEMMLDSITANGTTKEFLFKIVPPKAREYKRHPDLLVPEVIMRATLDGPEFDKVSFNCPGNNETHTALPFLNITHDGRFVTFATGEEVDTFTGFKVVRHDGEYVAYANGIVGDIETGLEWKVGPDRATTWDEARSWVQNLGLDGGGWRMPTMDELDDLYGFGAGTRNMTPLLETTGWRIWSGETLGSSEPWPLHFHNRDKYWPRRVDPSISRAFAVRFRGNE
ncbi:MAG: caspase family protein [Desulfobacterales bacterium]|uniref:Caspase family protein n=1 Tax=Candidatus Desulfatibia vada TaxID=2841696 RepID=A0A8J6TRM4_9BACT|nr:caspase family protein [Candidatus Desulfatibia vada]MBL6970496.1 caspase family protein [Desulfobacterales bacterium]MBL7217049.1 caspase family protein [Desulfobacteraceae bacterium]